MFFSRPFLLKHIVFIQQLKGGDMPWFIGHAYVCSDDVCLIGGARAISTFESRRIGTAENMFICSSRHPRHCLQVIVLSQTRTDTGMKSTLILLKRRNGNSFESSTRKPSSYTSKSCPCLFADVLLTSVPTSCNSYAR